jgi:hypothetical protein
VKGVRISYISSIDRPSFLANPHYTIRVKFNVSNIPVLRSFDQFQRLVDYIGPLGFIFDPEVVATIKSEEETFLLKRQALQRLEEQISPLYPYIEKLSIFLSTLVLDYLRRESELRVEVTLVHQGELAFHLYTDTTNHIGSLCLPLEQGILDQFLQFEGATERQFTKGDMLLPAKYRRGRRVLPFKGVFQKLELKDIPTAFDEQLFRVWMLPFLKNLEDVIEEEISLFVIRSNQ